MNAIRDKHSPPHKQEPSSSPIRSAPWFDLLVEASFVGIVFLVLTLIVIASVGH